MNTQEVIDKLTEHDRLIIRDMLSEIYSASYVIAMLGNRRKRTNLFKKTVRMYWEHREELQGKFENECIYNKMKEATV